ncbi:group I intron-associated PD-(D/E)XK endonuclease [Micropruina glycogenica]|uniref:group I intron-associated PD-(D/E)XK endonuclease n=1 Tax=Micropruina glycogenica TaxID=75385 RepID=UPI0038CBF665
MHPGLSLDRPRRTSGCSSDCRACAPPSRGSGVSGRVSMPGGSETAWRRHRKIARLSVLSMAHHTKDKGDLGVAKAHADLVSQGFVVLFPATEHAPIWSRTSTAVSRDCRSRTEQVARAQQRSRFGLSVWSDRHGLHVQPTDKSTIDVVCIYCPQSDACITSVLGSTDCRSRSGSPQATTARSLGFWSPTTSAN